jgi:pyruvate dehydrogenase E2 component (dihydrolipoamide acetyltransferase)
MKTAFVILFAAALFACDQKSSEGTAPSASAAAPAPTPTPAPAPSASAPAAPASTAAAAPTAAAAKPPTSEQYEQIAQTSISEKSAQADLDKLDKEIGQ